MKTGLLLDDLFLRHDTGPGHPESPARYEAISKTLCKSGVAAKCLPIAAREARDEELALAHAESYLELVTREIGEGRSQLSTGDTVVCPESLDVARRATGAALAAVEGVFEGHFQNAFCAVRPPGHHATPDTGMGFCLFNHIAIAARHAQQKFGAERIAIVDWDVHHGNGTQDIFYRDGSVFFFSTHQSPWYPGTGAQQESGEGKGKGKTLNAPLPAGSGFEEIGPLIGETFARAMDDFRPDLILISAGFDSRAGYPLGQFTLTDRQFGDLTKMILDVAAKHCDGRVVSLLEGGYNVDGLASAVQTHVEILNS